MRCRRKATLKQLHTALRDWLALLVYLAVGAGIVLLNIYFGKTLK